MVMAMDRHDKEKEMASILLFALYYDIISQAHISHRLFKLLESADDLTIDIPDTVDVLALFIARAVVDDIPPPAFLDRAEKHSQRALEILRLFKLLRRVTCLLHIMLN